MKPVFQLKAELGTSAKHSAPVMQVQGVYLKIVAYGESVVTAARGGLDLHVEHVKVSLTGTNCC